MISNLITVELPDNRQVYFREPSFYDFKCLNKMLISSSDSELQNCFNNLLNELIISDLNELNIIDKFLIIITIRNTILGNEMELSINGKPARLNLANVLSREFDDTPIEVNNLVFKSPKNFLISEPVDLLAECLVEVYKENVSNLTKEERIAILDKISIPLVSTHNTIIENFSKRILNIAPKIEFSLYGQHATLNFLKNILSEDLFNLMNFEYTCIRNLGFNSQDFKAYTYPELKIFLNHLIRERKQQEESDPTMQIGQTPPQ